MTSTELALAPSAPAAPFTDRLRLAVAAYLARFKGSSREHTHSDLHCYLAWSAERGLDPLAAQRPHLELYIRWMQEIRRFKPSTVSRRFSVVAGFYRTCVIDGLLEHSPAEHVRRPSVPAESPTLGFTHLQFEALLSAARESPNRYDFALVAMLGLLGLRIFEATGADIADLGEEHGHRVLRVCGKGTKVVLVPLPPAVGRAIDRAIGSRTSGPILLNSRGTRMDRHAATRRCTISRRPPASASPGHTRICSATRSSQRCSMPASTFGTSRSPPATRTPAPQCGMTGPARTWTATRTTSWPPTWLPAPDPAARHCRCLCLVKAQADYTLSSLVPDVARIGIDHGEEDADPLPVLLYRSIRCPARRESVALVRSAQPVVGGTAVSNSANDEPLAIDVESEQDGPGPSLCSPVLSWNGGTVAVTAEAPVHKSQHPRLRALSPSHARSAGALIYRLACGRAHLRPSGLAPSPTADR
jgi:integrase